MRRRLSGFTGRAFPIVERDGKFVELEIPFLARFRSFRFLFFPSTINEDSGVLAGFTETSDAFEDCPKVKIEKQKANEQIKINLFIESI